jgi:hypothetical protein
LPRRSSAVCRRARRRLSRRPFIIIIIINPNERQYRSRKKNAIDLTTAATGMNRNASLNTAPNKTNASLIAFCDRSTKQTNKQQQLTDFIATLDAVLRLTLALQ